MKIRIILQLILWKSSSSSELNAVTGNRYIYPCYTGQISAESTARQGEQQGWGRKWASCLQVEETLKIPAVLQSFFMGLSLVIKFHITKAFRLTLLDEMTVRALKTKSVMQSKGESRGVGFTHRSCQTASCVLTEQQKISCLCDAENMQSDNITES